MAPRPLTRALLLVGVAAITAAGQLAISPPRGWVVVHPLCWVAAFLWIGRCRPFQAFWSGWLIGAAANAALFHWIAQLSPNRPLHVKLLALLGFSLVGGFVLGVFAAGWRRVQRASGEWWPVGVAAWFTACEFLNWQWFPYYQGCAWWEQGWIFPVTSLTGVTFLTFLAILCNALVASPIEDWLAGRRFPVRAWRGNLAVLACCVAIGCGWSALQHARLARQERSASITQVALIRPEDRPRGFRETKEDRVQNLVRSTQEAVGRDPSIGAVVWPESAVSSETDAPPDALGRLARQLGIEVWTGAALKRRPGEGARNSAVRIDASGCASAPYDKCMLVPFGEAIPLSQYFPWLERLEGRLAPTRGRGPMVYETPAGRVAFLICYESIQYGYVRAVMRQRPDLLVVVSSDRWVGSTALRDQHFMLAAINAAQFGVPVVRCCAGGVCGLTDPAGRARARSSAGPTLVCAVRRGRLPAPYVWLGDWFAWGCVVASAAALRSRAS